MGRGAVGAFAGVLLLLFAAGSATSASTTGHAKSRWRATVAPLPPNAPAGDVSINAISCPSPGNCSAVGSYGDSFGLAAEGLLLTEKAGHWAPGVEAILPANAASEPGVSLNSVSCASAGNCSAVGGYFNSSDRYSGLLLTEMGGHWEAGVESDPPAGISSVSCVSPGNCTAVGGGLVFTEKAGHWASGVEAPVPPDAKGPADLSSVSCSSEGSCSAVGIYNWVGGRDTSAGEGVLLTEKRGTWRAVKAIMPPDGPGEGVVLTSVSCGSAGNCGAIGLYNINIDANDSDEGVLLTEKAGKWRRRGVRALARNGSSSVLLAGISCPSRGNCAAMGDYYAAHTRNLAMLTEEAGKWRRGVKAPLPRRVTFPDGVAISCASPGNCAAVAVYWGSGGHQHGLLLTEIAGSWARAVSAPLRGDSSVNSVSCASPGSCTAAGGGYKSPGGPIYGVLFDSSTAR